MPRSTKLVLGLGGADDDRRTPGIQGVDRHSARDSRCRKPTEHQCRHGNRKRSLWARPRWRGHRGGGRDRKVGRSNRRLGTWIPVWPHRKDVETVQI